MEVTKREVLVSIAIISLMLIIGLIIHGNINENMMMKNQEYNKAIQIENDTDLFSYGMRTNIGNAFVYGELKAVDTVTYPEIGGEYMYVEKIKERYTMHTETYTTTDSNGNVQVHTRTYWSWDYVGSENIKCNEISFCGVTFNSNKINLPYAYYIDTIKESSHIRYKYYGVSCKYLGTIFTELKNNTISDNTHFYNDSSIEEVKDILESDIGLIIFWIAWITFTGFCVYGFYYLDNNWLEDKTSYKRKRY